MAKLLATVFGGVWIVLALAVIVRSAPSSEDLHKRNDDDWKKLGATCAQTLGQTGGSQELIEFLSTLKALSGETDCSKDTGEEIIAYVYEARGERADRDIYAECFKLMTEYFALYLDECGLEESFRTTAEMMKEKLHEPPKFAQHETLISYFEESFLGNHGGINKLKWILEDIRDISKLEQVSVETDCTQELQDRCIRSFVVNTPYINRHATEDPRRREFERVKFAMYLDRCGYEKLLSERVSDGPWNSEKYKSLYSYFAAIQSANESKYDYNVLIKWLDNILALMRQFSATESISKEALCTDQLKDTLLADLEFTSSEAQQLYDLYGDYLTLYLSSCDFEEQFEKTISNVKQSSDAPWDSVTQPTLYTYIKERTLTGNKLAWILEAIEQLSALENMSKEKDCTVDLLNNLSEWRNSSSQAHPELHTLVGDYFDLYLSTCDDQTILENISMQRDCTTDALNRLVEWINRSSNGHPELHKRLENYRTLYMSRCRFD